MRNDDEEEPPFLFLQAIHHDNGLTAEATWVAKFWNAGEDVFASSGVKLFMILNSNMTFGFANGAGVVAAGGDTMGRNKNKTKLQYYYSIVELSND